MGLNMAAGSKGESNSERENDGKPSTSKEADEPMVEVKRSVFLRKSAITDDDISTMTVKCTACGEQINHHDKSRIRTHKHLGVLICKDCNEFYGDGEFSQDEDGDKYCRWCANGGKLFGCDFCHNAFCDGCIRRNFGRGEVREVQEKKKWECYCCDPQRLEPKVEFCKLIIDYSKNSKKKTKKAGASSLYACSTSESAMEPEIFVNLAFSEADEMCAILCKKVAKLREIQKTHAKSVRQVIKKMEQVVDDHKSGLKKVMNSLSLNYMLYVKKKEKEVEALQSSDIDLNSTMGQDDSNSNQKNGASVNTTFQENPSSAIPVVSDIKTLLKKKQHSSESTTHDTKDFVPIDVPQAFPIENSFKGTNIDTDEVIDSNPESAEDVNKISKDQDNKPENILEPVNSINSPAKESENEATNKIIQESNDNEDEADGPAKESENEATNKITQESNDNEDEADGPANESKTADANKITEESSDKEEKTEIQMAKEAIMNFENSSSDSDILRDCTSAVFEDGEIVDATAGLENNVENDANEKESSEEGSTSDSAPELPKVKSFLRKTKRGNLSKSKNCVATDIIDPLTMDDPKLKIQPQVVLERIPFDATVEKMLQENAQNKNALEISEVDDDEAEVRKLEKDIKSLSRPLAPKYSKPESASRIKKQPTVPKAKKKKNVLMSDSSSPIFLSTESDDEKQPTSSHKPVTISPVDETLEAKKIMLNFSSSCENSDLDPIINKEKSKKRPAQQKPQEDKSSDSDFQIRKKSKYDNLLKGSIEPPSEKTKNEKPPNRTNLAKKKMKRKIISSDEEKSVVEIIESSTTTSESEEEKESKRKGQAKKRKRIKKMSDSSSEGGVEEKTEKEDPSPSQEAHKGRKNIRKVISARNLTDETKEAQMEEKERKRRVQERQKLYNKIVDAAPDGKDIITRKMVLEVDQSSKEEIIEINPDIVCKLKPHQVNGVKFMWECTMESLKELQTKPGSGCILAHCMGLGKTLQVIAFIHLCLTNKYINKKIKTALVICPYNTVSNWSKEFEVWLEDVEDDILVHEIASAKDNYGRMDILEYWLNEGGVLIISYDIFRRLVEGKLGRFPKKNKKKIYDLLVERGPDLVVCDEGHILKNEASAISKAANKLRTKRRIVLTGTPLQNNLKEYHCMVQFVKPSLLGTSKEFRNRFVNPIENGQYDDSSQRDVKLMKKRVHILHKLLEGCVQRCDYSVLKKSLPTKHEFVISVKLSDMQIKLYRHYLDHLSNARSGGKIEGTTLFKDVNVLRCIWTYPYILKQHCERIEAIRERKNLFNDDDDFIDDASYESHSPSSAESEGGAKSGSTSEEEVIKKYKTRSKAAECSSDEDEIEELKKKQWYDEFITEDDKFKIELSGKMVLLMDILKECEAIGDKIIVFSQSLSTLDMIEDILHHVDDQPLSEEDIKRDAYGSWQKGIDYFRIDGSTGVDNRTQWIELFNNSANERARLFLISTKAGSLGTNLIGANRVVILDASWNPSHDVQAIFRVYRYGQVKPVYIYRLLGQGTMEEKIYDRQVTKLSLSIRVVDEQQIDRHFNAADLAELYTFNPESTSNRPTPMVPNDRLLAEMLIRNKEWIVTYHEHDSLLQNQTEEDLTEEERQAAWNEYENEKEGLYNTLMGDFGAVNNETNFMGDFEHQNTLNTNEAIKLIIDKVTSLFPNADQLFLNKKKVESLSHLKKLYQARHVKLLRAKQEGFANGSVSQDINQKLEEITGALTIISLHMTRIDNEILAELEKRSMQDRIRFAQAQQNQRFRMPQQQAKFQQASFIRHSIPRMNIPSNIRFATRDALGRTTFINVNGGKRFAYVTPPNIYQPTNPAYQNTGPIITEIEDDTTLPSTSTASNSQTVEITEVE